MSDTLAPAIPIRPSAWYGNTQARHDICRLLADMAPMAADEAGTRVAEVAARIRRLLDPARTVAVEATEDGHGMPMARIGAGGTVIRPTRTQTDQAAVPGTVPRTAGQRVAR